MFWVQETRKKLQEKQANVLARIAKLQSINGNGDAVVYYGLAANLDPKREDIAQELMQHYLQMGMPCEALSAYNHLYHELRASIGIEPNARLKLLAKEAREQCPKV
jgi:DNA-binding SARP family transcriptional activator